MSADIFQKDVTTLSHFVNEPTQDAVMTLQGDVAHCLSALRKRLERLAGQGGLSGSRNGISLAAGDPTYGF